MAVRVETKHGQRRIVIDILIEREDGTNARYRRYAAVQSLGAARAEEKRIRAQLATGLVELPSRPTHRDAARPPTFVEIANEYFEVFAPSHLKPSTQAGYERVVTSLLVPRIGSLRIDQIDARVVRQLDSELVRRGRSASTRRNVQSVLRSILCRYGVEAGYLAEPLKLPDLPRSGGKILRTISDDELRAAVGAARTPNERIAFMLAALAGLRAGEVRGLRWSDVDLDAGHLVVRRSICRGVASTPKSGHQRFVPLVPELRDVLVAARPKAVRADESVTLGPRGSIWPEYSLHRTFVAACKRAKVPSYRFHDLRHSFVSGVFRSGASAPVVQALAGHLHLTTTQRYAHATRADLGVAMGAFGTRKINAG